MITADHNQGHSPMLWLQPASINW